MHVSGLYRLAYEMEDDLRLFTMAALSGAGIPSELQLGYGRSCTGSSFKYDLLEIVFQCALSDRKVCWDPASRDVVCMSVVALTVLQ